MMGLLTCAVKGSTLFGRIVLPPPSLKNRAGGKGKKKSSLKTTKEDASGKIEV